MTSTDQTDRSPTDQMGWLVGPVLLMCAGWMLWGPELAAIPETTRVTVDAADFGSEPMRIPSEEPPILLVAGFEKKCLECHGLFRPSRDQPLILSQHQHVPQGHGMNDRCFNCHDDLNPSRLVLVSGERITFDDSPRLCANCHGPTFRDWEAGMHGRTTGSWDIDAPTHARLKCTNCHDPHAPAFDPMTALPGPNTLRLGDPTEHRVLDEAHTGTRNPLRTWSSSTSHPVTTDETEGEH